MSWFTDYRSHYFVGYVKGLLLRKRSPTAQREAILRIDLKAWDREWEQNLDANNPNEVMSKHQQREAMAWALVPEQPWA